MKTFEFLDLLEKHQDKYLLFQYAPGQLVGANYHITEVKNVTIDAVDCGGRSDSWKETVVQLWESPSEIGRTEFLSVYKAKGILKKVNRMNSITMDAEIKFEYGNALFHTSQLFVNDFEINEKSLMLNLATIKTDCKAKESCGVPKEATAQREETCAPGSGCC